MPTSSHSETYAKIVKDRSLKRHLQQIGHDIAKLPESDRPAEELVERAEQKLLALSQSSSDAAPAHIYDIGAESYERYAKLHEAEDKTGLFGITTGFLRLDQMLTGLPPGHLMIVAARPSVGKTAFALDIAQRNPPIPVLSDLRESGAIEQDADSVLMLYRGSLYNEDCDNPGPTDV